jgi:hypothetical protein
MENQTIPLEGFFLYSHHPEIQKPSQRISGTESGFPLSGGCLLKTVTNSGKSALARHFGSSS